MTSEQRTVFGIHLALLFAIMAVWTVGYFSPSQVIADGGPLPYHSYGSLLLYYMFHTWLDAVWISLAAIATVFSYYYFRKAVES